MEDIMSNCNDLFLQFYDNIKLSSSKKDDLRSARDAIREKIRAYFKKALEKKVPDYKSQGSFSISCVVNPLSGEFDIDDGVYLQNLDNDKSNWESPETVHRWIIDAVRGHTKEDPIDKRTCVRVIYSGNYHVDLPIYGVYSNHTFIAEKGDIGWHSSDPVKYSDWFINRVKENGEQLRRILIYLKAWADYKSSSANILNSFSLSILVANHYQYSENDDTAFSATIKAIYDQTNNSHIILNPVDSNENIGDRFSSSQWKYYKEKLLILIQCAGEALKESSKEASSKLWRKEFGERFPEYKDPKSGDRPLKTSAPAILGDDGRSA